MISETACENQDRRAEEPDAYRRHHEQRRPVAEHGARRPPHRTAAIGHVRNQPRRLQRRKRQAAVGEDRRDLQPDDEGRADHCCHDLRNKPRALGADGAEQRQGQRHSESRRYRAHSGGHAISSEPAGAAEDRHHVDERRRQQHREQRNLDGDAADAHREYFAWTNRRGQDEIKIGTRIEDAGNQLHRLRQQRRQQ